MNRYITITLSPWFERSLVLKFLAEGNLNRTVEPERLDPSGQGVNVARALHRLDCPCHAVLLLGNDLTGRAYRALLADEGFQVTNIYLDGPTPSYTYILDRGHKQETAIHTEGAPITEADIQRLSEKLETIVTEEDIVVFTGPLPPGAPTDSYTHLIEVVHAAGAKTILVADGAELNEALPTHPMMVVVNQIQCESFFNMPMRFQDDLLNAAGKLQEMGVEQVLIEILKTGRGTPLVSGEERQLSDWESDTELSTSGAILVTGTGRWKVDLPEAPRGTSSGMWEAFLAGFLAGQHQKMPIEVSLELAAAAAAHAADFVGSEFAELDDLEDYRMNIQVQKLKENHKSENPGAS